MTSKSALIFIGVIRVLLRCVDSLPSSVMFLAVYNTTATRAEAYEICNESEDRLPQLESPLKSAMINRAVKSAMEGKLTNFSAADFNYWIGLELEYTWGGEILLHGNWSGWQNSLSPPIKFPELCVTSDVNGLWNPAHCFLKYQVVCEWSKKSENCPFEEYKGDGIRLINDSLLSDFSTTTGNRSRERCGQFCLDFLDGCRECWVWTYIGNSCVLYISCSPLLPDVPMLQRDEPTFTFYFKNCYIGYFNNTPINYKQSVSSENSTAASSTDSGFTTQAGHHTTSGQASIRSDTDSAGTTKYKCEPINDEMTPTMRDTVETGVTTVSITDEVSQTTTPVISNSDKELTTDAKLCACSSASSHHGNSETVPVHGQSSTTDSLAPGTTTKDGSVDKIMESLNLNVTKTSAYRRRHTSATDDRPSAQSVGYVGIVLLCTFAGVIVCFDLDFALDRVLTLWRG